MCYERERAELHHEVAASLPANALEDHGVSTVEELMNMQAGNITVVPNLGDSSVRQFIKQHKHHEAKPPWTVRFVRPSAAAQSLVAQVNKQPKSKSRPRSKVKSRERAASRARARGSKNETQVEEDTGAQVEE